MTNGFRRLLMLRHAKAVSGLGTPDMTDHARPLAERGRRDAVAMGVLMRERALHPTVAMVSTTMRTRETFGLLGPFPDNEPRLLLADALYLAEPDTLLDMLRKHGGDAQDVLLVGHNPGLHELAMQMAPPDDPLLDDAFPTCTLAVFCIEGSWASVTPAQATLLHMLHP